ncbi:class I SAM-dependent rRNA methyltransferase [Candidatus Peregrinibacteria bacterium]|nr:class I SAM-dependent rRNA methyltransferase [Candidatus Peregrinibacteria bacterium]
MYPQVLLRKDSAIDILKGHPWIFTKGIQGSPKLGDGDLCEVHTENKFVGIGYWDTKTDIAVRILTRTLETIDESFFLKRFTALKAERERFVENTNAYRMVFGESDGIPGLIIDRYDQVLVVQFHTWGIRRMKTDILNAMVKVFSPQCVYEKSSESTQKKEGFEVGEKLIYGEATEEVEIVENGFKFLVNIPKGQKTGFFLDQRQNRHSVIRFVRGLNVLNSFAYTGGFSVYAASVAKKVTTLDISKGAVEAAIKNFEINGFDPKRHEFVAEDAFEYLKRIKPGQFDCILLDPPSFAHRKLHVPNAIKAYIGINTAALKALPKGGILISSSCTAHIDEPTFIKILHESASHARCGLKVLHSALQPPDHPYNLFFPEGRYLKFFVLLKD